MLGASHATPLTLFSFLTLPSYQFSLESSSPPPLPSSRGQAATFPPLPLGCPSPLPLPRRSQAAHRPPLQVSPGAHPRLSRAGGDHTTSGREQTASLKASSGSPAARRLPRLKIFLCNRLRFGLVLFSLVFIRRVLLLQALMTDFPPRYQKPYPSYKGNVQIQRLCSKTEREGSEHEHRFIFHVFPSSPSPHCRLQKSHKCFYFLSKCNSA